MCDTIVAPPGSTADHVTLFGKNSDRQRNEAQAVELLQRRDHAHDTEVRCTYIAIPQVRHTHTVLLSRPFWIWGAEMGANEHGVVIGNEGLHARRPAPIVEALTGMDLLRLALERASTATEAVDVITGLLRTHGQGGNCGHLTPSYYHNGFLISDVTDTFVLETVERDIQVERVQDVRSLSNTYSIDKTLADPNREHIGQACAREARSASLLRSRTGRLTAADMRRILRDHGPTDLLAPHWNPRTASDYTLCMHAGPENRPGQTTASLVSEIGGKQSIHWITASSAPCISVFKPVLIGEQLPSQGPRPTDRFDGRTVWWRHETLHRAALSGDFLQFLHDVEQERDTLESTFEARVKEAMDGTSTGRSEVIALCWREAFEAEDRWRDLLATTQASDSSYDQTWAKMSSTAGMP